MRLLIDKGAGVDKALDDGTTPPFIACFNGSSDCARLLIDVNADASIKSKRGETPLDIAISEGHDEIAQMLTS